MKNNIHNYITKDLISSIVKESESRKYGVNHILSPMGSGKTTSIKDFIRTLDHTKKVLVLAPYRTTKNEFSDIVHTELECVIRNIPVVSFEYITKLCENIAVSINDHIESLELDAMGGLSYGEISREIQSELSGIVNNFDYIFIDETDFAYIQAFSSSWEAMVDPRHYEVQNRYHSMSILITMLFMEMMHSDVSCISISANSLEVPPATLKLAKILHNEIYDDLGYDPLARNIDSFLIRTIDSGLKSALSIGSVKVIFDAGSQSGRVQNLNNLIDKVSSNTNTRNLIFKSSMYSSSELEILRNTGAYILARKNNIRTKYNNLTKSVEFDKVDGYSKLMVIGEEDDDKDNLSDKMYEDSNTIAINVSSSRSVSLVQDTPATVLIITNSINTTVTQVVGRFRNANMNIIIYTRNPRLYDKLYEKILECDCFIADDFANADYEEVTYVKMVKGRMKEKKVGAAKGKAISQETKDRRDFTEQYVINNPKKLSLSKEFNLYKLSCAKNNIKPFGLSKFKEYTGKADNQMRKSIYGLYSKDGKLLDVIEDANQHIDLCGCVQVSGAKDTT